MKTYEHSTGKKIIIDDKNTIIKTDLIYKYPVNSKIDKKVLNKNFKQV